MTPPTLETGRLRLRAPTEADFETVSVFLASERARFVGGPYDLIDGWRAYASSVGSWLLQGFGYWGVEEREGGALVGAVGFLGRPVYPEPELGWDLFDARFEGRGYATEAGRAARDWGFAAGIADAFISCMHPENHRSMRVAERLGAERDPAAALADPDDVVYRHRRRGAAR